VDESPARRFFSIFNRAKQQTDTVEVDTDAGEPLTLSSPGDDVLVQALPNAPKNHLYFLFLFLFLLTLLL
jgi:hypothetical protein